LKYASRRLKAISFPRITDNYSWRWIFYINVPVGLIATTMMVVVVFVHDPAYLHRDIKTIDLNPVRRPFLQ
jgi:MFS family permease